ncbi:MAG: hypothetical protein AB7G37_17515 [Solirubrobacteraceae bacterium]
MPRPDDGYPLPLIRPALVLAAWTIAVTVVAVACVLITHHVCSNTPPPYDAGRPPEGTPRAGFCSAVDPRRWWIVVLAPLLPLVARALLPRRPWVVGVAACLTIVALIALPITTASLRYAVPQPSW